ncbi:hypothetical protein Q0Z83_080060 [Actinoplanes sichuanensis]|uniref:Flagellin n=1 Tax=Actinoplanes sichuanensis TaxID=512349 RepID=A0ABW4AD70_9ACTN|nr:flagellin [Actinoplanes sichuanensis]BEL09815.1 hypothetical protein Q0Z83_080060 [Actinoplanes sichuanensis]
MGLRINQNIAAQNAYRNLSVTDNQMAKSLEKLSSGFRINRASDDAAGLSISEGLRSQTSGLKVAVRNTQDGVSVVQTAEGALNESTAILQRMRDLAVQTSNAGAVDADAKDAANKELQQLNQELDRIGRTTSFGKSKLFDGSFGAIAKTVDGRAFAAGTRGAAIGGVAIALTGGGATFKLTQIDGAATVPATGIDVTLPAGALSATSSGQDVAKAVNTAISAALKGAGYQGNEVQTTASTAANGDTTFSMSGTGTFKMIDGAYGVDLLAKIGLAPSPVVTSVTGSAVGNLASTIAALDAVSQSFDLTQIDGAAVSPPVTITIASGSFSNAVTGQDVADVINAAITTGLTANGYAGNEIKMTAGGDTFSISGGGALTMTDGLAGAALLREIGMPGAQVGAPTSAKGSAVGNLASTIAALDAVSQSFDLTQIDGAAVSPPVTITIASGSFSNAVTGQDVADVINAAITTGLTANGYAGNEITMSAATAANGDTTFSMSGTGAFTAAQATATDILGDLALTRTTTLTGVTTVVGVTTIVGAATVVGDTTVTDGNTGRFQVGADPNERIGITITAVNSNTLGTAALDLTTVDGPDAAITALNKAIGYVSDTRANLGAYQNRFEHTINNLNVAVENLSASESRIRDADIAAEMVTFTRVQILTQAGTSMLSQANQSAQSVMSLLRG